MPIIDVQTEHAAQHYIVFTVNHHYVFRFARDEKGTEELRRETERLLPAVSRAVKLAVPVPRWHSFGHPEPGFAFAGYERIDGEPLWPGTLEALEGAVEDRAAAAVAGFLRDLHAAEIPPGFSGEPPRLPERDDVLRLSPRRLYARVRESVFPRMGADLRRRAESDFETLIDKTETAERSLVHGAFGPAHLLWDSQAREVSGVIGFGSSRADDPAVDLAGLLAAYGPSFFAKCLNRYGANGPLEERARLYAKLLPLREALYGSDEGDEEGTAYGLEAYAGEGGR
ncbi:phosphotransferase family protein [Saccharibacillus alkalitolerans]|uniref:Aminoglycoside phosphotransferase family protein n=1 Tax=Saccharibacillus alkalitolerans TaxID=2705290 RepID=A0ABX0F2B2_9BACL|nr:aminoglycoside phosphotransferase family protein [Saccharibacillus alkalitolerans]NGZ74560.1 aminoglycoside phosphotransferase family protein [Saccharibacillus alkalitolerans]